METDTIILMIFSGVVTAALVVQTLVYLSLRRAIESVAVRFEEFSRDLRHKIDVHSNNLTELMSAVRPIIEQTQAVQSHLSGASKMIHDRVADMDEFLQETIDAARLQIVRIQDVIETTSHRVEGTVEVLHDNILKPIAEFNAIVRGLRTGLEFLFRGYRRSARQPHQEEEMFI